MDSDQLIEELEEFRRVLTAYDGLVTAASVGVRTSEYEEAKRLINERFPVVIAISKKLEMPEVEEPLRDWNNYGGAYSAINATDQLLGRIRRSPDIDLILGGVGPRLAATSLHRWVWNAASDLWDDGHPRAAVEHAATSLLEVHLPSKLKVDKSSADAKPSSAWSVKKPEADSPRLRLTKYTPGTDDWNSAHTGAMHLGMACQALVRNLTAHNPEQPEDEIALEHLALLSAFARLVDEAELLVDDEEGA